MTSPPGPTVGRGVPLAAGRAILRDELPAKRTLPVPLSASHSPARSAPDPETTRLALDIAAFLDEKQAESIVILDVSGPLVITDYFVVATVRNARQAVAIARELDAVMKARGQLRRNTGSLDGEEPNWVLLDLNDVVVHLFLAEARAFYDLESLWADAPRLPLPPPTRKPTGPVADTPRRTSSQNPFRILPGDDTPDSPGS